MTIGQSRAAAIAVRGIKKAFPGVLALDDVDLEVRAGEVHALLGANGAGKSTLIKIIAGLIKADAGEIAVCGRRVILRDTHHALSLGINVIYQELALVPELSVAENLFLGQEPLSRLGFIDWRRVRREAQALLDRVGASFAPETRVRQLGSGQRQLVEIARALRADVAVLILDEPTAALSQAEALRLFAIVRELAAAGVGILYVTHRLEDIAGLVDRVTILRDGRSVGTYPSSTLDRQKIVSLIVGHERAPRRARRLKRRERLLEVRGLTRRGEFEDISLDVHSGEIVVLTGLVGAGRTELLQALFAARRFDGGEIYLNGKARQLSHPADAIAAGIVLIPEDRRGQGIAAVLPIFANITLAALDRFASLWVLSIARELGHSSQMMRELAIKAPGPRAIAASLSGGNQQKVVLAKWLSTSARVLLLDEPTQGIDIGAKDEIYQLIDQLSAAGKGILIASSDLEEVLAIADRVLTMREGKIVARFERAELRANSIVDAMTHG